jgi:predicted nucleic acid-binding protein
MLIDTSGLLCYHDRDQAEHEQAKRLLEQPGRKLPHNYVLVEFVAVAHARKLSRKAVLNFLSAVLKHPLVETVWVDEGLHRAGMELLRRRIDRGYSLCDAVSFILMHKRRINEALTTDHHFEQEGLRALLREQPSKSDAGSRSPRGRRKPSR